MKRTVFPLYTAGERMRFAADAVEDKFFKSDKVTYSISVRDILNDTAILDVHFVLEVYMTVEAKESIFIKRELKFAYQ